MSDTSSGKSPTSPASNQTFQASTSTHIRKRASTLRQQATNVPFFSPQIYRHSDDQDVPAISVRESSTFCLKAIVTVVSHGYRHEFGAACISSPTSRPSSSPRRGRSASALSPATDSFGGLGFASSLRCARRIVQNLEHNNTYEQLQQSTCTRDGAYSSYCTRDGALSCCGRGEAPSPNGRVLFDLASSCLAYVAVVALRSSASDLAHTWYSWVSRIHVRVVSSNQSSF